MDARDFPTSGEALATFDTGETLLFRVTFSTVEQIGGALIKPMQKAGYAAFRI